MKRFDETIKNTIEVELRDTIYTVDALAGAGKTYQALRWAAKEAAKGERILFIQPTKELIDQSHAEILTLVHGKNIEIKCIHGDSIPPETSVTGEIVRYLKTAEFRVGTVLFITHVAFLGLPYFHNQGDWKVICDEVFNVLTRESKNLRDNFSLITDLVDARPVDDFHYVLVPKEDKSAKSRLRKLAENIHGDDVSTVLQQLAKSIFTKGRRVLIKRNTFESFSNNDTKKVAKSFLVHVVIDPSIFRKFKMAIIMSALFDHTQLSLFWSGKVLLQRFDKIQKKLRYLKHENLGRISFKYFHDGQWTQNFYLTSHKGKKVFEHYVDAIRQEMQRENFLYSINVGSTDPFNGTSGIKLPNMSHGLNSFQSTDHVAFLSALQLTPDAYSFCNLQGITSDEVERSTMMVACYQAIMRSSIRDPQCTRHHIVIVPTKDLAEQLATYFSNSDVSQLNGVPNIKAGKTGRPRKLNPLPSYIRERNNKRRKEVTNPVLTLNGIDLDTDENTLINNRYYATNLRKSLFPIPMFTYSDVHSTKARVVLVESESDLELGLRKLHNEFVDSKDQNLLISPCIFKSDVGRKKDDVSYCWCMMLDVDGGDLSPEDLNHALAGIRMFCFSTFSGERNRYRVIIPISHKLTATAYEDVFQSILKIIEIWLSGHRVKNTNLGAGSVHKIDPCSKYPTQLYYAPCQPSKSAKTEGFFETFPGDTLDVLEYLLRPKHEDAYRPKQRGPRKNEIIFHPSAIIERKIEEYKKDYKSVPKGQSLRNSAFFRLGIQLLYLGISFEEIEHHLVDADGDKSRDVKGVLNQLKKPQYQPEKYHLLVDEEIKKRA